ncbi:MAG: ATP-binding protein [Methanosarcinales archaeon]|nr:ATP-binding protein [Methanosarcinales archaeon]
METRILKELILEQKKEFEKDDVFVKRSALEDIENYLELPHIIIISGLRRSGKSTLLKEIHQYLFNGKTVYYFNFEDERLINFTATDFNHLYETFLELLGPDKVFFFDEIQNVQGWELFVRRMYDKGSKFIITGSNSSMLSRELGTRLTGRYIAIELFPFSFKEYINSNHIDIPDILLTEDKASIKKTFNKYLRYGGIPEYLRYRNDLILKTLYENILYKDIFARYGLNNEKTLKELSFYLFSNYASEISYNKLRTMLDVSINTVKSYMGYLENSYLIFSIPRYDYSIKKQIYSHKKVYVIDQGLINLISFKFSKDHGKLLENIVFLELRRRHSDIYYHRDKHECDFIVMENGHITDAIQVTASLNGNSKREYDGLLEALDKYGLDEGLILTDDEEFEDIKGDKKIIVMPIWKWLLET